MKRENQKMKRENQKMKRENLKMNTIMMLELAGILQAQRIHYYM